MHRSLATLIALPLMVGCMNDLAPVDAPQVSGGKSSEHVIVGTVGWIEASELADGTPERTNSHAVAYLSLPSVGSRCTGFLVAPDVIMTNEHCVPGAWAANNVTAIFGREAGAPSSTWASYDCSTFLGNDAELDYALLQCAGRPGDTFGVVELDAAPALYNESLYVVHQNCDYYSSPSCEPSKKYSAGRVTRVNSEVGHDADTLGGSSGSPVFRGSNHKVFALHHVGLGNGGDGRGSGNYAVPMSRIVPDVQARFPDLDLGGVAPAGQAPVEPDALEPNDDDETATPIALPYAGDHTLHEADADVLRLEVTEQTEVLVEMHLNNAAGDLDVILTHVGSDAAIARGATTSDVETFTATVEPGAYLVRVSAYQGATNAYTLSVRLADDVATPSGDAFEPNDDKATAAPIPAPFAWDALAVATSGDVDHYRVNAAGPTTFKIRFAHADGDLDLSVLDEAGQIVGSGTSTTDDETVELDLSEGVYVVRVYGYAGATGTYDLRVGAP
jgi:V8-like Glu-specific endopeptidase